VIEIIDKVRRRCLWRNDKNKERVNSLAAWDMVFKPNDKGGLGILIYSLKIRHFSSSTWISSIIMPMFHG
jgi:hypothetical protein